MGGGPCVRLVLPWSGSSPAIEAAGRQNRAGGGTHRGTEAAAAFALPPPPMYKSSLSLCLFLPLLGTLNCNKENHCISPTTFYQERSNALCHTSQSNVTATDMALLSKKSDAHSTPHLFCAPCRGNEEL